jgi:hypothetical protein
MRTILSLVLFLAIPAAAAQRPPIRHVFTIILENKSYSETFGPNSRAPYLSKHLTAQGGLLTNYYAIGHNSLDNYVALISGQAPNPFTQSDCQVYQDLIPGSMVQVDVNGQVVGQGCVYSSETQTIVNQLGCYTSMRIVSIWRVVQAQPHLDRVHWTTSRRCRDSESQVPSLRRSSGDQLADPDRDWCLYHQPGEWPSTGVPRGTRCGSS